MTIPIIITLAIILVMSRLGIIGLSEQAELFFLLMMVSFISLETIFGEDDN